MRPDVPFVRTAAPDAAGPAVILTFHGIGLLLRPIDARERHCWIDQGKFEAVLDLVATAPGVELTFDDGNASDLALGVPALQRRGLTATFFVCAGRLGQPTFLTPSDLRALEAEGMRVGSHGVDHRPWRKLSAPKLDHELRHSRAVLEDVTGHPITNAACPFGSYDRRVIHGLRRAGYRRIYTSDGGIVRPRSALKSRTTITQATELSQLEQLLRRGPSPANQWVIDVKRSFKRLR